MVYEWKVKGIFKVPAQVAGEELERIKRDCGSITAENVVRESESESAPLHNCFEWRDDVAAVKYRENQAERLIRLVSVQYVESETPVTVRAFYAVERDNTYEPSRIVLNDSEKRKKLLNIAYRELRDFERKFKHLSELESVFSAISELPEIE